jgi:dipeptidyl aminopeptidase/acylaminoacyl peptidase
VATLVFSLAHPAAAETRRAFAIEDLYRLKGVGEPAISPDGKTIVYTLTTSDLAAGKQVKNLWRIDADGGNARRLTTSDAQDSDAAYSPDGRWIGFLSTRAGESQLFLLPVDGGEPQKKTDVPGGVGEFVFSPDGKRVVFPADVYLECGADMACNRKLADAREKTKIKAHLADSLLFRHWTDWKDGKRTHLFMMDLSSAGDPRDLTPGDFDAPVFSVGGARNYAVSPDGKELAFASNHDPDQESSTNADIFTVAVDASDEALRSPTNITAKNPAWDGHPRYSPDGRAIAYRAQNVPRYESDLLRLSLYDRAARASRTLTAGFDNWVDDYVFTADGKRIVFTADVKGRTPLHELDLATGKTRTVSAQGLIDSFAVAPGGAWAVASRRQVEKPSELFRIELAAGSPEPGRRLTTHNADVEREVDIRPVEEIWVPGAGGRPVQVFIVKPHGFDAAKKYPLILNVHGGPQSQWADSFRGDWQVYPGAGYVVAFPNPHGSTGFGQDYTAAISGDWTGAVMEDIEKVTAALARQPYVDSTRMGAMGWSWGGYAMMWLEGRSTAYKALASMMGVYDLRAMHSATEEIWFPAWDLKGAPWENPALYRHDSPSEYVTSFKTPCLVITGEKDYRVPYTQSLEFFTDLQRMKVPSRLIVFEKAGHWPAWNEMALYYDAHLDWFHRYLGGAPAPWDPKDIVKGTVIAPPATPASLETTKK